MKLEWKLRNYLENHSLTGRALALEAGLAPQAVYRILKAEGPDYLHRPTLEKVLTALSKLTGSSVTPNDLLEVIEEPPTLQTLKPGEVAEDKLKITPAQGKFAPKFPTLKSIDGSSISDTVIKQREERALAITGIK